MSVKSFNMYIKSAEVDDLLDFIDKYYCYSDQIGERDLEILLQDYKESDTARTAALTVAVRELRERLDGADSKLLN